MQNETTNLIDPMGLIGLTVLGYPLGGKVDAVKLKSTIPGLGFRAFYELTVTFNPKPFPAYVFGEPSTQPGLSKYSDDRGT